MLKYDQHGSFLEFMQNAMMKGEHEEAILADLKRLDITPSSVSHTSDHFEAILKIQTQMIADGAMGRVSDAGNSAHVLPRSYPAPPSAGLAYVDPSKAEEQQAGR